MANARIQRKIEWPARPNESKEESYGGFSRSRFLLIRGCRRVERAPSRI